MAAPRIDRLPRVLFVSFTALMSTTLASASALAEAPPPVFPDAAAINALMATAVPDARLAFVHLQVTDRYPASAPVVWAADRDLRRGIRWVEGDPRRTPGLDWNFDERRGDLPTLVEGQPGVLAMEVTRAVAKSAVDLWTDNCFAVEFRKVPYPPRPGWENIELYDDYYLGAEPTPFRPGADIVFGGRLPAAVFDLVYGPNGEHVLAFAVTYAHWDFAAGRYTDIDGDGNLDAAWSEIYFNDRFYWADLAPGAPWDGNIDLNMVALHEAGHAFGLGHFGRVFLAGDFLHVADYNVMTNGYFGPLGVIGRTARAGFCSLFADWR